MLQYPYPMETPMYSYTMFGNDTQIHIPFSLKNLKRIDYVDFRKMARADRQEFYSRNLDEYFKRLEDGEYINPMYSLKKFSIKEVVDDDYVRPDIYAVREFVFYLHDWISYKDQHKYDNRKLYIDIYDTIRYKDTGVVHKNLVLSATTFAAHKEDNFRNLERYLNVDISDLSKYKMYEIPIYLIPGIPNIDRYEYESEYRRYNDLIEDPTFKYQRFSDVWKINAPIQEKRAMIEVLVDAFRRFISLNFYLLKVLVENEVVIIKDTNRDNEEIRMESDMDRIIRNCENRNCYKESHEIKDKHVVIELSELTMRMNINYINKNLVDDKKTRKQIRKQRYKYQVKGHFHHYWVGHGLDKHLEAKWIDPYFRNKDMPAKIIKEGKILIPNQ